MLKPKQSLSRARKHVLASCARENRRSQSEPERRLWAELAGGKLGVAFRRQVVIRTAIADFFAPAIRLVVEVDGAQHRLRRDADARRDRDLRRLGCQVLRIDAQVVMRNLQEAVALVRETVERLTR